MKLRTLDILVVFTIVMGWLVLVLPAAQWPLRNTICGSRSCQMCVGIALQNNYGVPWETLNADRQHSTWLAMWDALNDQEAAQRETKQTGNRAVYGETPPDVVEAMLDIGRVGMLDTVYDLGSGDGRIVLAAARDRQARAVGLEIDGGLVRESTRSAVEQGVGRFASFRQADVIESDFADADVITAYLTPDLLERLMPKLRRLRDGVRIVCHEFPLPGVPPEEVRQVHCEDGQCRKVFLWTTPLDEPTRERSGSSAEKPGPDRRLIVVGASWCPACRRLESSLRAAGVPFEHVTHGSAGSAYWMGGYTSIPVVALWEDGKVVRRTQSIDARVALSWLAGSPDAAETRPTALPGSAAASGNATRYTPSCSGCGRSWNGPLIRRWRSWR